MISSDHHKDKETKKIRKSSIDPIRSLQISKGTRKLKEVKIVSVIINYPNELLRSAKGQRNAKNIFKIS